MDRRQKVRKGLYLRTCQVLSGTNMAQPATVKGSPRRLWKIWADGKSLILDVYIPESDLEESGSKEKVGAFDDGSG